MKLFCTKTFSKAISWRIIATAITGVCAYVFTGSFDMAVKIFSIDALIKFFAYYVHEKVWEKRS